MQAQTDTSEKVFYARLDPPCWFVFRFDRSDWHAAMQAVTVKFARGEISEIEAIGIQAKIIEAVIG